MILLLLLYINQHSYHRHYYDWIHVLLASAEPVTTMTDTTTDSKDLTTSNDPITPTTNMDDRNVIESSNASAHNNNIINNINNSKRTITTTSHSNMMYPLTVEGTYDDDFDDNNVADIVSDEDMDNELMSEIEDSNYDNNDEDDEEDDIVEGDEEGDAVVDDNNGNNDEDVEEENDDKSAINNIDSNEHTPERTLKYECPIWMFDGWMLSSHPIQRHETVGYQDLVLTWKQHSRRAFPLWGIFMFHNTLNWNRINENTSTYQALYQSISCNIISTSTFLYI
jgi:hypothetical protein